MQHYASRTLIAQSLWEQKLLTAFPSLNRALRFFMLVGLYSAVSAVVVWGSIFIIWSLVMLAGDAAPPVLPHYI